MKFTVYIIILMFFGSEEVYATGPPLKKFVIEGRLRENDNGVIYIYYNKVPGSKVTDSADVSSGLFEISGKISEPTVATLYFKDSSVRFYIEPVKMKLFLEGDGFSLSKLVGSSTNDDFVRRSEQIAERKDLEDALKEREIVYRYDLDFLSNNPGSFYSLILLDFYYSDLEHSFLKAFIKKVPGLNKRSYLFKEIRNKINLNGQLRPGVKISDFSYKDYLGNIQSLSQLFSENDYVLIDIWASWCIPCRKNSPFLNELFLSFKDKKFQILSISLDKDTLSWKRAIKLDKIDAWKHSIDDKSMSIERSLSIISIPTMMLVDKKMRIIGKYNGRWSGNLKLRNKLAEIFAISL